MVHAKHAQAPPSRSFWNIAAALTATQFQNVPDDLSLVNSYELAVRVMIFINVVVDKVTSLISDLDS